MDDAVLRRIAEQIVDVQTRLRAIRHFLSPFVSEILLDEFDKPVDHENAEFREAWDLVFQQLKGDRQRTDPQVH